MACYTGKWEYDVFVCFRGKDTRRLFTSHLAEQLRQRSIRTFTDEIFDRTEEIDAGLLDLLERSAMSVVIFSESFAESSYCLDEVAAIAQSVERFGHRVLPVFYGVDPDDVAGGVIVAELNGSVEKKKRWMDGLKEVSKLAGRTSKEFKDDCEMCKKIVDDVLKALSDMCSKRKPNNLVGMETRISEVCQLLTIDGNTSNVIGLWGMGGVGKTTLARTLYNKLTYPTNGIKHHFISIDINDSGRTRTSGVDELVQQLYSTLLSENNVLSLQDLDLDHRRERLSRLKVVVVLDNVETPWQLEQLLLGEIWDPTKIFGPDSIIIITSRNMRVLLHVRAKIHCMEGLNSVESLQLFNLHAFRQLSSPSDDLKALPPLVVSYCKGNPLALKVLGGALYGKEKAYWKSFFLGLKRTWTKLEIHSVLSTSYYALKDEEKRLFMDVACFPFNTSKTRLVEYLATSYESPYSVIEDLIDKSLMFTIPSNDLRCEVVVVHDLLKEMAWNIVKEEPLPSRLRNPSDIYKLFAIREAKKSRLRKIFKAKARYEHTKDAFEGGKSIQSLSLNLSKTKDKEVCLVAKAFEGMDSLRFLGFYGHQALELIGVHKIRLADGGLDTLPNELRWLEWTEYPLKCLPPKFHPEKLVTLSLQYSQVQRCWPEGLEPKLVHLITLDLSYCIYLKVVPNLLASKKLELLRLKGCKSLVELPSHVQDLGKLVEVDLCGCLNLVRLPARFNSKCLKYVRLAGCPKLTHYPEVHSSEGVLQVWDLDGTPTRELPIAVHKFNGLHLRRKCITTLKRLRLCHITMTKDIHDDEYGDNSDSDISSIIDRVFAL